jgi:type IV secretory pathway VirB4 component
VLGELPLIASWANLFNSLGTFLVLVFLIGAFLFFKRRSKDWNVTGLDNAIKANSAAIESVRIELSGHKQLLKNHDVQLASMHRRVSMIDEGQKLLTERVTSIGESHAKIEAEHRVNHPIKWDGDEER